MKLLYKTELTPYLNRSKDEIIAYAKQLVESHNATCYQMANELSYMMRRNNRLGEAVEISRMMFENAPSVDRLNLYLVAVVDQGDISSIRELSKLTDEFLKRNNLSYQKHLFATWLKAANKILDDDMFQYVYEQVPTSEKGSNTYIISQFYVYKNRHSQYEEVCKHYEQLPPHIQNSTYVKRYYQNARIHLGYPDSELSSTNIPAATVRFVPPAASTPYKGEDQMSNKNNATQKKIFLVYGGNPVSLSTVEALLNASGISFIKLADEISGAETIIEAFERYASQTDFAIVLCTPEVEDKNRDVWYAKQNVILEFGYFMARLGRKNVCLLCQKDEKNLELPSDVSNVFHPYIGRQGWTDELGRALRNAGFPVTF